MQLVLEQQMMALLKWLAVSNNLPIEKGSGNHGN